MEIALEKLYLQQNRIPSKITLCIIIIDFFRSGEQYEPF